MDVDKVWNLGAHLAKPGFELIWQQSIWNNEGKSNSTMNELNLDLTIDWWLWVFNNRRTPQITINLTAGDERDKYFKIWNFSGGFCIGRRAMIDSNNCEKFVNKGMVLLHNGAERIDSTTNWINAWAAKKASPKHF